MIAGLNPYRALKDSGVSWLGEIPAHWGVVSSRRVFSARKQLARPEDVQLSATQAYGVIPQAEFEAREGRRVVKISMHLEKRRHVERDDFVISMRSFQGGLERAWASGCIRSSYVVLKAERAMEVEYFAYLFKSKQYIGALQAMAGFIRDGQDLNYSDFCSVPLPDVPISEQRSIAQFLAYIDRRIRRYVRTKQKQVKLLDEQKQAIVHRAVTRGLDPNVRLKPSGIEWLGDVPQHWEVWQVGHFSRVGNGSTPSRENSTYWESGSYPWLNSSSVNRSPIRDSDQFVTEAALRECHLPKVPAGSVLVAITGQGKTRGKSAVLVREATINQHIAFITPRSDLVSPEYLHLALTGAYRQLRSISDSGGTKGALTCSDISHFRLALPPTREQAAIVERLRRDTDRLQRGIAVLEAEVRLLEEFREGVVAQVVTGKLDVRAAVAGLPTVSESEEPEDHGPLETEESEDGELDLAETLE